MRIIRWIHAGSVILTLALSGALLVTAGGCGESKKENELVPGPDPAKLQAEKDAREKFMKEAGKGKH
jgi:hypothetical protein